jgi:glycosyltransferase involved in cell wall biosynthesis
MPAAMGSTEEVDMRCLFVIRELPRAVVSMTGVIRGSEALSGTHASGLLVAEGLARRGRPVGVCILRGQRIADSAFDAFSSLEDAVRWLQGGRVIWLSYGDEAILEQLRSAGVHPVIWTQLPVSPAERRWLESGRIGSLVTVSDTCRIPLLRSRLHSRVGRIYNPLAPAFTEAVHETPDRYERRVVAYAGAAGPTKGLHRLLEMWRFVQRVDPGARLRIAGTGRLYGSDRKLGRFGMASPEFESRYVAPLAEEYGSLAAAGVEVVGLLTPTELRDLYGGASLGVVNMNWSEFTETFCCAATEMMATGLPVFSVARGALPETVGRIGGAVLVKRRSPQSAAAVFASLLRDPRRLAALGRIGRSHVVTEYRLDRIVDEWARLLDHDFDIETLSGPWRGPVSLQYIVERAVGRLGMPWLVDAPASYFRRLRRVLG